MNGVGFGDSLDSNGRGGLAFGSSGAAVSSAGAGLGTGRAPVAGEWERFRSSAPSASEPFSCDAFGSSVFSSLDLQFSSTILVSVCAQVIFGSINALFPARRRLRSGLAVSRRFAIAILCFS